jgi:RNA polymerase sigma factor (TIGR02999 family)
MDEMPAVHLLRDARVGDRDARDRLVARAREELEEIAREHLQRSPPGEPLSTTELVREAYVRLVDQNGADARDRAHFHALASRAVRLTLVGYARDRLARSLAAERAGVQPDAVRAAAYERATDLLSLHQALEVLSRQNERLGRMVEYRFFGGLSYEEIAEVAACPVPAVKRDWNRARAWLYRTMHPVEA